MAETFVTQCPHCSTSFRLTKQQLAAAKGSVRCGACLQVFAAVNHIIGRPAATSKPSPKQAPTKKQVAPAPRKTTPNTTPTKPATETFSTDLDGLVVDDEPNYPDAPDFRANPSTPTTADNRPTMPVEPPPVNGDLSNFMSTSEWESTDDQDSDSSLPSGNDDETDFDDIFADMDESSIPHTPTPDIADPSGLGDILEDADLDNALSDPSAMLVEDSDDTFDPNSPIEELEIEDNLSGFDEDSSDPYAESLDDEIYDEEELLSHEAPPLSHTQEFIANIAPDPVNLDFGAQPKPWGKIIGWSTLNIIALTAFALQYAWFNFEQLARQHDYRPYYQLACEKLECDLPPISDVTRIRSGNTVMRSHPDIENALVIDLIIINKAAYVQPFPALQLEFSNISDSQIASRTFSPKEYLGGELTGMEEMPMQTPIHLSLEIVDPGAEAVNYNIDFLPL